MSMAVARFDTAQPADVSGLAAALQSLGGAANVEKAAVFLKVEGDYDDGAREKARAALEAEVRSLGIGAYCQTLVAVGCEGVATPFGYLLAERRDRAGARPAGASTARPGASVARLAMGFANGDIVPQDELDSVSMADRVAETVRAAMADAQLSVAEVAVCFVKLPAARANGRGDENNERVRGRRTRAIGALGAGIALGEIDRARVTEAAIVNDPSLHARRVQSFAGAEVTKIETIVLGNRPGAGGDLIAASGLLTDLIDAQGLKRLMAGGREESDPGKLQALFIKAGAPPDGTVRGGRTTIFSSGVPPEKYMRAALSGLVAAVTGDTRAFITGDPIQAAPEGGGSACVVLRVA